MDTLAAIIIVLVAFVFVAARLSRPFRRRSNGSCAAGCGGCPRAESTCSSETSPRPFTVLVLLLVLAPASTHAADTIEVWDVGALDIELYLGLDTMTDAAEARALSSEFVIGFGLVEGFSVLAGMVLETNGLLDGATTGLYLGGFGTAVDTDHLDLDLLFQVSARGAAFDEFEVAPALELNVDLEPDLALWGAYLRVGVPIFGRTQQGSVGATSSVELAAAVDLTLGTYLTAADGHQLFVELDSTLRPDPLPDERTAELGGLAFGYNVVLTKTLELITQLSVDVPQSGETAELGIMIGAIGTLER